MRENAIFQRSGERWSPSRLGSASERYRQGKDSASRLTPSTGGCGDDVSFDAKRLLICLCAAALLVMATGVVGAWGADEDGPDLRELTGKTVTIQQQGGKSLDEVEVVKVVPGGAAGSARSLTVKGAKGKKATAAANTVVEIFLDGQPLDVAFDKRTKTIAHDAKKRQARLEHDAEVQERLSSRRHRLWPELSADEHVDWLEKHKEFLEQVQQTLPQLGLQLVETKYYLFLTDIPPDQANIYLAYLDSMYEELCKAFNIPKGKNIWCGKCVVVAFRQQADFLEFESRVMKYDGGMGAQGLHHGEGSGRVVISCWKGDTDSYFASVLVHETAHGFVHRYKSTVPIISWVNEGIAEWVAANVVTADKAISRKQRDAAERVAQTSSLGGTFYEDGRNIDSWQYGVAVSMVDLMLRINAAKYRQFFDGMKEGLSPDESLKQAYGLTRAELTARYGESVGVPNLKP